MSSVTYYVALPFIRTDDGTLVAGEAQEKQTASAAVRTAQRMAETSPGAVAFSRTGDPSAGEFEDAVVIQSFGEVPSLDELLGGSNYVRDPAAPLVFREMGRMKSTCDLHMFVRDDWRFSVGHDSYANQAFEHISLNGEIALPDMDDDCHPHSEKLNGRNCLLSLSTSAHSYQSLSKVNLGANIDYAIGGVTISAQAEDNVTEFEGEIIRVSAIQCWVSLQKSQLPLIFGLLSLPLKKIVTLRVLVNDAQCGSYISPGELYREEAAGYPLVGYTISKWVDKF